MCVGTAYTLRRQLRRLLRSPLRSCLRNVYALRSDVGSNVCFEGNFLIQHMAFITSTSFEAVLICVRSPATPWSFAREAVLICGARTTVTRWQHRALLYYNIALRARVQRNHRSFRPKGLWPFSKPIALAKRGASFS